MNFLLSILTLCFLFQSAWAGPRLKQGDILLLELNCWSCQAIARETQSRFSHSGLVVKNSEGQWRVLESLHGVSDVSLESFVGRNRANATVQVMRAHEAFAVESENLWRDYQINWKGLPFDADFLWDNYDNDGQEKLYCSEFISKFLQPYLGRYPGAPAPMDYTQAWDFWVSYFRGSPPQGRLGNSPASFERDPHWFKAFEFFPHSL